MKRLASEIYDAVKSGKLKQPFDATMVKAACPGWEQHTYFTFLGEHAVGNGQTTELFVKVSRGMYRVKN